MRTTKPISTVSFNTAEYLEQKLTELQRAGIIAFWAFMTHLPEEDETKEHHHLFVEPSKMLQTEDLKKEFLEPDPANPLPRGTISWQSSRFDTWYLYALHDRGYLRTLGEDRKFAYRPASFKTSDRDDLNDRARRINLLAISPYQAMEEAQAQGLTWAEFFSRGTIPIQQTLLAKTAWYTLHQAHTDRANRQNHPDHADPIDPSTGEVIEEGGDPS